MLAWPAQCEIERYCWWCQGEKRNRDERDEAETERKEKTDGEEAACVLAAMWKLNLSFCLTECLNCTSFTDMNSRINAIESKVKRIPLIPTSLYTVNNLASICTQITLYVPECRCVWNLLLSFQIKLLEEGRSSLPTVSSSPEGSTDNEVDTPQPTPIGPPSYLPPGVNTCFLKYVEEVFRNMLINTQTRKSNLQWSLLE